MAAGKGTGGIKKAVCGMAGFLYYTVFAVIGFFGFAAKPIISWTEENFGVSIQEILFTIKSPMKGADAGFLDGAVSAAKMDIFLFWGIFFLIMVVDVYIFSRMRVCIKVRIKKWHSINVRPVCRFAVLSVAVFGFLNSWQYLDECLGITQYLELRAGRTEIYEDYYVDPLSVEITFEEHPKNLIYIYMESMENTYASEADGGCQEVNYIPHLTEIARENISFSNNADTPGGWHMINGSGWTMGALLSTTAGIPFSFPVEENSMNERSTFASGVTNLGDILEREGYKQVFLCGSDGTFAGRADYFKQHGNYEILDYYKAIEKGYVPEGYAVWWGFEDEILYDIAKEELVKLWKEGSPFNFTMLTVDTHHIDGYVCGLCGDRYEKQLANVLECADSQVYEFVEWCREQEFFEDTVIVISGDHPRMDNTLVAGIDKYHRTIYNAFINVDEAGTARTQNREFAPLDMFPTVLGAMGFRIEGDRLGLGTNLFSDRKTLMEELGGYDILNSELGKYSVYYHDHFD